MQFEETKKVAQKYQSALPGNRNVLKNYMIEVFFKIISANIKWMLN